jgi:hypothetical protein
MHDGRVRLACVKADRARALLQVAGGADSFCNFALVAVAAPDLQNVLVRSCLETRRLTLRGASRRIPAP